jgi:hypothetical protein
MVKIIFLEKHFVIFLSMIYAFTKKIHKKKVPINLLHRVTRKILCRFSLKLKKKKILCSELINLSYRVVVQILRTYKFRLDFKWLRVTLVGGWLEYIQVVTSTILAERFYGSFSLSRRMHTHYLNPGHDHFLPYYFPINHLLIMHKLDVIYSELKSICK